MEPVQPRQQTPQESEGRAEDTFLLPLGSPTPSTCYNCQHAGSTRLCLNSELADSCGPLFWTHLSTQSMSSISHSSALLVNITPPVSLSRRQSSCWSAGADLSRSTSEACCELFFFSLWVSLLKKNHPVYLRSGILVRLVRFYYWISTDITVSICCS